MSINKTTHPCVGWCTTSNCTTKWVCMGCGRTQWEQTNWGRLSEQEKANIITTIQQLHTKHGYHGFELLEKAIDSQKES
jgi:predicted Fe-S protein YdhL (DUF1289 family)